MTHPDDGKWLQLAQNAYTESTDWVDSNLRNQWERNYASFNSKHAGGSKYSSDAYRGRSRLFMPKTRANLRGKDATVAAAYFATGDVINVAANDPSNDLQQVSAKFHKEILEFRLKKTVPWFKVLMGAWQDCEVAGVCFSYQGWDFQERDGAVLSDKPIVELIPPENFRFHPGANWLNPIETSPYLIWRRPMTIEQCEQMMAGSSSGPTWRKLSRGELMKGTIVHEDTTEQARSRNQTQKNDPSAVSEFTQVWIHLNIVRIESRDFAFWTVGTEVMLTDPVPADEIWHHNMRPFAMGIASLESHQCYPAAAVQLGQDVQVAINDTVNQRRDNVALVLNKRYRVKRGSNVDMRALSRSAPGGMILMDDLNAVATDSIPDVTGSSYQEQDRLQMAFDDVSGGFSSATVQGARALNETVGGMEMISDGTNMIKELELRTFNETWVENVLRQLLALEALYETDEVIMKLAADAIDLIEELRDPSLMSILMEQDLTLDVAVGIGAVNPQQKIGKIVQGIQVTGQLLGPRLNVEEVSKEVWGALGYKEGGRFILPPDQVPQPGPPPVDPAKMLMAQVAQFKAQSDAQNQAFRARMEEARLNAEVADKERTFSLKQAEIITRRDAAMAQIASKENIELTKVRANFDDTAFNREMQQAEQELERFKLETQRQIAAVREQGRLAEMDLKRMYGQGI